MTEIRIHRQTATRPELKERKKLVSNVLMIEGREDFRAEACVERIYIATILSTVSLNKASDD